MVEIQDLNPVKMIVGYSQGKFFTVFFERPIKLEDAVSILAEKYSNSISLPVFIRGPFEREVKRIGDGKFHYFLAREQEKTDLDLSRPTLEGFPIPVPRSIDKNVCVENIGDPTRLDLLYRRLVLEAYPLDSAFIILEGRYIR